MEQREIREPYIEVTFSSPAGDRSISVNALVDTGASTCVIPAEVAEHLSLPVIGFAEIITPGGYPRRSPIFDMIVQIQDYSFHVEAISYPGSEPLLGWNLFRLRPFLILSRIFGHTLHVLDVVARLKENAILILGQDTTEIHRLRTIQKRLELHGYTGIIPKEVTDIGIQSVEEKVNMLASLCRFVICENSVPSGHIDELKICALNRFVTAIFQEKGKGATWMQSDYPLDFPFMKIFTYASPDEIDSAVDDAFQWAEDKIKEGQAFFNNLYTWRDKTN